MKRFWQLIRFGVLISPILGLSLCISDQVFAGELPPRWVELELEEIEGATAYELEFKSEISGKTSTFKTESSQWKAKVKPGKYQMRLRSYDGRKVPGPWSEPSPIAINFPGPKLLSPAIDSKVASDENDTSEVKFQWENIPGVPYYKIEVKSGDKTWTEVTTNTDYEFKLPVEQSYDWTVYALQDKSENGEPSESPGKFLLQGKKLSPPKVQEPMDEYVNQIEWKSVEYAKSYSYVLSRQVGGQWKLLTKKANHDQTKLEFPVGMPGGKLKLQVRADSDTRPSSDISAFEFPVFEGKRDPASIDESRLKNSIEKPTDWYGIASYFISPLKYSGVDVLATGKNNVSLDPIGGTGRVGAGYFQANKPWGFIGFAELSGFTLKGGKTATYPAVELHAAWRKYFGSNQLRLSGGLYNRKFIEVYETTPNTKNFDFKKFDTKGVHAGFEYWHPINFKYGIQVNSRLYMPMSASTPEGFEKTPSYSVGIMGSKRIKPNLMGFVGYAYRVDTLKYRGPEADSFEANPGTSGDPNQSIKYSGHYLNLLLEWGF